MFPDNSFLINFVSGAVAGSIASTITLPFDVIKTIKQIEMGEKDIMKVKAGQARSNMTIAKELISEQGVKSLFSGKKIFNNKAEGCRPKNCKISAMGEWSERFFLQ